jgi:hypothetical protein
MDWQALRTRYPHAWLVVEAHEAHTQEGQRLIAHLEMMAEFGEDWDAGWARYKALHAANPEREYYLLHTDRAELNIGILDAFGRVHSNP